MPITKQAIKRMKQDKARTARNRHYNSHMKSMIKLIMGYVQKGETDKANKILPKVVSSIDVASKKKLIHNNNASRKKAGIQRAISSIGKGKAAVRGSEEPSGSRREKAPKAEKKETKKETKKEVKEDDAK